MVATALIAVGILSLWCSCCSAAGRVVPRRSPDPRRAGNPRSPAAGRHRVGGRYAPKPLRSASTTRRRTVRPASVSVRQVRNLQGSRGIAGRNIAGGALDRRGGGDQSGGGGISRDVWHDATGWKRNGCPWILPGAVAGRLGLKTTPVGYRIENGVFKDASHGPIDALLGVDHPNPFRGAHRRLTRSRILMSLVFDQRH